MPYTTPFCFAISVAFATLREIVVLRLPGDFTFRDYTNVIRPKAKFRTDVLYESKKLQVILKNITDKLCCYMTR